MSWEVKAGRWFAFSRQSGGGWVWRGGSGRVCHPRAGRGAACVCRSCGIASVPPLLGLEERPGWLGWGLEARCEPKLWPPGQTPGPGGCGCWQSWRWHHPGHGRWAERSARGGVWLKWVKAGVKWGLAGQETRQIGERGEGRDEKSGLGNASVLPGQRDLLCIAKRGDGRDSLGLPACSVPRAGAWLSSGGGSKLSVQFLPGASLPPAPPPGSPTHKTLPMALGKALGLQ